MGEKIIIIGCPGAGKSTFARALRDLTGLPLYYLDRIYHRADRTTIPRDEFDEKLGEILRQERFIIDGNYNRTMEMRLAACDTVFLMDYPTEVCLAGARERVGKLREDMPWTEETLDPEFGAWIESFAREQIPKIYERIEKYREGKEIYIFKSREEAQAYLDERRHSAAYSANQQWCLDMAAAEQQVNNADAVQLHALLLQAQAWLEDIETNEADTSDPFVDWEDRRCAVEALIDTLETRLDEI